MTVELKGGSLFGVCSMARAQGAKRVGAAVWSGGYWRINVILPVLKP